MADKRISQLVERVDIANNDVVPIVASGATTTNKATISSIQTFMQENLDVGVTSVGITIGTSGTDVNVTGSPVTTSGNITINIPTASATNRGLLSAADWSTFTNDRVPYTGANDDVDLGYNDLYAGLIKINGASAEFGGNLGFRHSNSVASGTDGYTSISTLGSTSIKFRSVSGSFIRAFSLSMATLNPSGTERSYTLPDASGTLALTSDLDGYVTLDTAQTITAQKTFTTSGSSDTMIISHGSGSGFALDVLKAGNNEALRVTKTSGSGNAMTVIGGNFEAPTIVKTGGTSSQFLKADGSVDSNTYLTTGSATSTYVPYSGAAASVNLGVYSITANAINSAGSGSTAGQINLRSDAFFSLVNGYGSIASGTTNQFNLYQTTGAGVFRGAILSLNSITESATRTYTLPNADGTLALTSDIPANIVTGTGTTNYLPKFTGASTIGNSAITEDGTTVTLIGRALSGTSATFSANMNAHDYNMADWKILDWTGSVAQIGGISASQWNQLEFFTSGTSRLTIASSGFLKASNTGTYLNSTAQYHELVSNQAAANPVIFTHTHSSDTYGPYVFFQNAAPNNSTNYFLSCGDNVGVKFTARSNGGLANFQANDTNLSDIRTKKDIEPLESYWDKFKAIEIVKFKYKDQTHDDFNIGVIAQQVESVAPEFVDVDGWDTKPKLDEEGNEIVSEEEPLKSIYTADLHHATIKVLQEAMAKIEKLETEIDSLKNQIK